MSWKKVNDNIIVYIDAMAKTMRARRRRKDIFTTDDSLNQLIDERINVNSVCKAAPGFAGSAKYILQIDP